MSNVNPEVTGMTPEQLRAEADRIESLECTGVAAQWCPVHGTCSCPDRVERMDDPGCPLHSRESSHAEAEVQEVLRG